jgi:hypothetical protein
VPVLSVLGLSECHYQLLLALKLNLWSFHHSTALRKPQRHLEAALGSYSFTRSVRLAANANELHGGLSAIWVLDSFDYRISFTQRIKLIGKLISWTDAKAARPHRGTAFV